MFLDILQFIAILLVAFTGGMFWGPWLALSRSMASFAPEVFLPIVHRMDRNMSAVMTILFPLALIAVAALAASLWLAGRPGASCAALAALALLLLALVVTMRIEVPIVAAFRGKTVASLQPDWALQRDRWVSFHLLRVGGGAGALALLLADLVLNRG